jgi:hypothetical protein
MEFSYTENKADLGLIEDCWACLEPIDLDSAINNVPDCVICDNGHRIHRKCYDNLRDKNCGICRAPITKNCYSRINGYGFVPRKGGKRKTRKTRTNRKKRKSRKYKRR